MTQDELKIILEKHGKWTFDKDCGERANLRWANLSRADLSGANLSRANLSWANLSWANLSWANLSRADLSGANLSGADLSGANLRWANLSRADLSGADLSGANLSWANLSWANLRWANLIVIHPGPRMMTVTKTHVHIGCERFPNNRWAKKIMAELAKRHFAHRLKAKAFLRLYLESLVAANKLMKLGAISAKLFSVNRGGPEKRV